MEFLLFVLATLGLIHIIVDSSLFEPIREWWKSHLPEKIGKAITCHQCTGFWSGAIVGAVLLNPWLFLLYGFVGSYLGMWSDTILSYIESKIPPQEGEE